MILKAGTYRWNEVVDTTIYNSYAFEPICLEYVANMSTGGQSADVKFYTSTVGLNNEANENLIAYCYEKTEPDLTSFGFVYSEDNPYALYYEDAWVNFNNLFTNLDQIKTFTLPKDTEVTDVFGNIFIANTNYNEVNAKPLAEITYNGETIAQLNAGETATLSCEGKKMASDVVVKVDRVIIPKGDVTFNENGSYDVANKSTAIVDVPTIIDVTELPTNPKDTDTRSIYRCNGKLYVVDKFGAGATWRIDNTRTGTMEIDGMAYWDIPFESNGETFSNFGITRGDSTNSFCHIDYNGSRVYTATAKSQGTWTNENYRTVRLLKNVSSGYHSLGSWLSANGERVTNVWVEYIKPEGTLELVFNNIEAEFPIDCSQYANVTVNTAEPLKISDPTVLDNITDSPWGVGGSVFLYEGATTDSYEKDALYYLEDTEK